MTDTSAFRLADLMPAASFAGLALLPLMVTDSHLLGIVTLSLLWAAASLAWNLSGGYAGQLSLGHAAFYGLGAYVSTLLFLKAGISPLIGMWVGAAVSAVAAIFLGAITMRLKGSFFVMSTLAFGAVVHISAINLRELTGGPSGLSIPLQPSIANLIFANKIAYAYLAIGLVIAFYLVTRLLLQASSATHWSRSGKTRTRRGRSGSGRAAADRCIRLVGGNDEPLRTLHAEYYLYIDPDSVMGLNLSLNFALMAIVGGLGTAYGPIIGALLVTAVSFAMQAFLGDQISGLTQLAYAAIVIVVLLALPAALGRTCMPCS